MDIGYAVNILYVTVIPLTVSPKHGTGYDKN